MIAYREILPLGETAKRAGRAYGANSGHFHLAAGADHSMILADFHLHQNFLVSGLVSNLQDATSNHFELTERTAAWSGHGNANAALGVFGQNDPSCFRGLRWQYAGFTSTTTERQIAEEWIRKRAGRVPLLLEFQLPPGFRLLPMKELGPDMSSEWELLLPANSSFKVTSADVQTIGGIAGVLHILLEPLRIPDQPLQ